MCSQSCWGGSVCSCRCTPGCRWGSWSPSWTLGVGRFHIHCCPWHGWGCNCNPPWWFCVQLYPGWLCCGLCSRNHWGCLLQERRLQGCPVRRVRVKWRVSWLLLVEILEMVAPDDFLRKIRIPRESVGNPWMVYCDRVSRWRFLSRFSFALSRWWSRRIWQCEEKNQRLTPTSLSPRLSYPDLCLLCWCRIW